MKNIIILSFLLLGCFSWSQKDELKELKKLLKSEDTVAIKKAIASYEEVFITAKESKYKANYYWIKGQIAEGEKKYKNAIEAYQLISTIEKVPNSFKTKSKKALDELLKKLSEIGFKNIDEENFIEASEYFYFSYLISPDDLYYLYYAAETAINNKDYYDNALKYYLILKDKKYTGITTKYFATEIASEKEIEISELQYKLYKKSSDYTNVREEQTESQLPRILQNIAYIYVERDEKDKAIEAVKEARLENPENLGLIITEANLYIQLGDKEKFKSLMLEAVAQAPDNPELYFNLGIINRDQGNKEEARKYYEKAIELNDTEEKYYTELVGVILADDKIYVEKINKLVDSRKRNDIKRYEKLKGEREKMFQECIPILEKLIEKSPNSSEGITTLKNIYGTVGNNEGFKRMKKLLEQLEEK